MRSSPLLLLACLLPATAGAFPVPGIVPEKSYTLGPTLSLGLGEGQFIFGVEGAAARRIFWSSFAARLLFGGQDEVLGGEGLAFSAVIEAGASLGPIIGLGYHAEAGNGLRHGPTFSLAAPVPVADVKKEGFHLLGATPFLEPYYRLSLSFGEGLSHELGLSVRLWWH